MQQMQEEQEEQRKQAADAMAAAEEQHGLELQRLNVERSKLQVGGAGATGADRRYASRHMHAHMATYAGSRPLGLQF